MLLPLLLLLLPTFRFTVDTRTQGHAAVCSTLRDKTKKNKNSGLFIVHKHTVMYMAVLYGFFFGFMFAFCAAAGLAWRLFFGCCCFGVCFLRHRLVRGLVALCSSVSLVFFFASEQTRPALLCCRPQVASLPLLTLKKKPSVRLPSSFSPALKTGQRTHTHKQTDKYTHTHTHPFSVSFCTTLSIFLILIFFFCKYCKMHFDIINMFWYFQIMTAVDQKRADSGRGVGGAGNRVHFIQNSVSSSEVINESDERNKLELLWTILCYFFSSDTQTDAGL